MTGVVLGTAMLVASSGISPVVGRSGDQTIRIAITYDLPDATAPSHVAPQRWQTDRSRAEGRPTPLAAGQVTTPPRHTKMDRVIAVTAGVCLGWVLGGGIGYYATADRNRDDDGVSGLKGMVIGAPIGAAAGAILGYQLTKR